MSFFISQNNFSPSTGANTGPVLNTITLTNPGTTGYTTVGAPSQSQLFTASMGHPSNNNGVLWSHPSHSTMSVQGDADFAGDVRIQGVSIKQLLETIQDRLAILVPDPQRLEKYEALKQCYEHYKVLEALCVEGEKPV